MVESDFFYVFDDAASTLPGSDPSSATCHSTSTTSVTRTPTFLASTTTSATMDTKTSSSSITSITSSPSSIPTTSTTAAPDNAGSSSHHNVGAIAGGVLGGLAGVAILCSIALFLLKIKRRESKTTETQIEQCENEKVVNGDNVDGTLYHIHTLDPLMASFQNGSGDHHSTHSRDVSGPSSARVFQSRTSIACSHRATLVLPQQFSTRL
jgi:hypothetical protein